jgi:hypothetical protein
MTLDKTAELHSSPNIISMFKLRMMIWAGHVAPSGMKT